MCSWGFPRTVLLMDSVGRSDPWSSVVIGAAPPTAGVDSGLGAMFESFGLGKVPDSQLLALRVGELFVAGDPVVAARVSAAARTAMRSWCGGGDVTVDVGGRCAGGDPTAVEVLVALCSLLVAAAALSLGSQRTSPRASADASAALLAADRPGDGQLVAASGLLAARFEVAARAEVTQLCATPGEDLSELPRAVTYSGLPFDEAPADSNAGSTPTLAAAVDVVSVRSVAAVLRRSALVCANTELSWAVVAAAGWLAGTASTIAGSPVDPAGFSFELRGPFDAAALRSSTRRTPRRGVPLQVAPVGQRDRFPFKVPSVRTRGRRDDPLAQPREGPGPGPGPSERL